MKREHNKLYDIKIVKKDGERVRIHFIGYSSKHDKWTDTVNIVNHHPVPSYGMLQMESYRPLNVHK